MLGILMAMRVEKGAFRSSLGKGEIRQGNGPAWRADDKTVVPGALGHGFEQIGRTVYFLIGQSHMFGDRMGLVRISGIVPSPLVSTYTSRS